MPLLLIRHGETALNAARVLQPADTPLNERGLAQAAALARRLRCRGVAAILSSDLPRALRTAELIAQATGAPIETTPLLHERNFGDLRGQPYDGLGFDPRTYMEAPPGGESAAAFARRVAAAWALAVQRRAALVGPLSGPLVVVSHGLVIGQMLAAHVHRPAGMGLPAHLGNTALCEVAATAPHEAALLNCTRHLDEALADAVRGLSGG